MLPTEPDLSRSLVLEGVRSRVALQVRPDIAGLISSRTQAPDLAHPRLWPAIPNSLHPPCTLQQPNSAFFCALVSTDDERYRLVFHLVRAILLGGLPDRGGSDGAGSSPVGGAKPREPF